MPADQAGIRPLTNPTDITPAALHWDDNGQPLSQHFGDYYFSLLDGLTESEYVFQHHNRLAQRFAEASTSQPFVIAETGFGSGLNFLCAWRLWQKTAPKEAHLHFISVEKHPLTKADLQRVLSQWPELNFLAQPLIDQYPTVLCAGFHRIKLVSGSGPPNNSVTLTLILDDATHGFHQLLAAHHPKFSQGFAGLHVDAWFLDGFSPAKNPQMWSEELFAAIGLLSKPGTTLATYTSAGMVNRGLRNAGFQIDKVPGFNNKREMIRATFSTKPASTHIKMQAPLAWPVNQGYQFTGGPVAVIGAGLAGSHTARALADRNIEVHLFDRHAQPASEASGNPQGVIYAKLSPQPGTQGDFNCLALLYAQRHYRQFWHANAALGQPCGVLQLAGKNEAAYRAVIDRLGDQNLVQWLTAEQASEIARTQVLGPGLFFPHSGWLPPVDVCNRLTQHPNIELRLQTQVQSLHRANTWQLLGNNGHHLGDYGAVVITNANDAKLLEQTAHLPLKPVRGQVSLVASNSASERLKVVVCSEGYIAPHNEQQHCLGATFDPNNCDLAPRSADHQRNIASALSPLPELHSYWSQPANDWRARVALRATTPDYLPIVGPVANPAAMDEIFTPLRRNARTAIAQPGEFMPGLFVNVGHGSRGLTYTPICAELLAAHLLAEPPPLAMNLNHALHPARFIIRDLMRNRR